LHETALHFADEIVDGYADGPRLINFFIGFGASVTSDSALNTVCRNLRGRSRRRRFGGSAAADRVPNFGLFLVNGRAFADAGVNDGIRSGELRASGPAAVFDAENIEREWRRSDWNDAVLTDDAILLAAEFAGEEQQRTLAAIDENKLINGSARGGLGNIDGTSVARTRQAFRALLADEHFAGGQTFFECKKETGVLVVGTHHRENRDVLVVDGVEEPPFAFGPGWRSGRRTGL